VSRQTCLVRSLNRVDRPVYKVHARSVWAAVIDTVTGEVIERTISPRTEHVVAFDEIAAGHGPVMVTYEAGPTGYGLARAVLAAGHGCQVAAPSKLLRPAGDRVKTDARDAMLLARLARNDDIVAVTVPSEFQESARDMVRAREDARMVLMSARHRLSKLLLRHGHVYDEGDSAWAGRHDAWLRRTRKEHLLGGGLGTLAAFDDAYDAVTHTLARRDRLDAQIAAMAARASSPPSRAGWGACVGSRPRPVSRWRSRSVTGIA
jgi:transposase